MTLETPEDSICPPDSDLETARINITSNVSNILQEIAAEINTVPECGGSGWRRVAFLNMTDPTQQCPDSWREHDQDSVRACGHHESGTASCSSVEYSPDGVEYAHVCGRIIGYQFGSPDGYSFSHGFYTLTPGNEINEPYIDGVSVTYGNPRQHIWTLYGGVKEFSFGCCNALRSVSQPPPFNRTTFVTLAIQTMLNQEINFFPCSQFGTMMLTALVMLPVVLLTLVSGLALL